MAAHLAVKGGEILVESKAGAHLREGFKGLSLCQRKGSAKRADDGLISPGGGAQDQRPVGQAEHPFQLP
jgi:hypothetical protein